MKDWKIPDWTDRNTSSSWPTSSATTIWDNIVSGSDTLTLSVHKRNNAMFNVVLRQVTPSSKRYRPPSQIVSGPTSVSSGQIYTNRLSDSRDTPPPSRDIILRDGDERTIKLPDGSRIELRKDGSFELFDADAKVTYRANRVRNYNTFLNASDKLEAFIRFCGTVGVRQDEVLRLPIELFIAWLVIEAARQDGEAEPDLPLVPDLKKIVKPRCNGCGRFLALQKRQRKIDFCAPRCFERHYVKALAA